MISPDEEASVLARAYVPEHTVGLMRSVSRGEPFLLDQYLCFAGDRWVIVVGYPLDGRFTGEGLEQAVGQAVRRFRPTHLWFIAPEVPTSLARGCRERESDRYYTLAVEGFEIRGDLRHTVRRASRGLTVERERRLQEAHRELISEFLAREQPRRRVRELFLSMAEYVPQSDTATVLTARDGAGHVSAFYVVELAAPAFGTYVVGCHSKTHYARGASDLLFPEMVSLAREHGKRYLHLGLGVNEGIRAFKAKWGGVPSLRYEFCERFLGHHDVLAGLASRL